METNLIKSAILVALFFLISCNSPTEISENKSPVITSISVIPDTVFINGKATLISIAFDEDQDRLTYKWWVETGRVEGSGAVVEWFVGADTGLYTVKCVVSDSKGGIDIDSIKVPVLLYPIPEEGLRAYYDFEGDVKDKSGNGYDGMLLGGASISTFLNIGNNDSDRVSLPASVMNGLSDFTISAWVRLNNLHTGLTALENPAGNTLISCAREDNDNAFYIVYEDENNSWAVGINSVRKTDIHFEDIRVRDQKWHHIAVTREGKYIRFFVDGANISQEIEFKSNKLIVGEGGFILGQDQDSLSAKFEEKQSFAGDVDDLRIYNRVLLAEEIYSIYEQEKHKR